MYISSVGNDVKAGGNWTAEREDDDRTRTHLHLGKDTAIGHYRIVSRIGSGGMGEVYLAEDTQLDRKVALKFLPAHLCHDDDCRARFRREAQAAARLNHSSILTVYEVGEFRETPFIATEYVGDTTLRDLISQGNLELSDVINITIQVCEGLQEAHGEGVVHRDIKPSNIVFEKRHHPKIVDFGLAAVAGTSKLTRSGATVGTMSYMSPEQVQGGRVDHRTDLFSLGVVLYEMVTGRNPFAADQDAAVQHRILTSDPEPVARFKAGVPEGLQEVVGRALEKDPNTRYQSAADMAADLRRLRRRSSEPGRQTDRLPHRTLVGTRTLGVALIAVTVMGTLGVLWSVDIYRRSAIKSVQRHIAVLPLANFSSLPADQAICDGLAETIASRLTQMTDVGYPLQVVPLTEIRDREVHSIYQARKVFGVGLAITGGVQVGVNNMRLTLNLVDATTQRQKRSVIVDKKIGEISVLQDSIVAELAQMLDLELPPESRRALASGTTQSSPAYYAYLRGRGFLYRFENAGCLDSAASLFNAAIAADSNYALAYAGLGDVFFRRYMLTMDVQWVKPSVSNAVRALEIDDDLAPVLATLGLIHRMRGQYEEAVRYLRQALEIDSLSCQSYRELALTYEKMGRQAEAEATYRKAIRLYPADWSNYYYLSLFNQNRGHRDDAIQQAMTAETLAPVASYPASFLGGLYAYLRMKDKAKALLLQAIDLEPNYFDFSNLGAIYQTEKEYVKAAAMYEQALHLRGSDYRVWINLASIYMLIPGANAKVQVALDSAIIKAEQNLRVNPDDPVVMVHLADCYAKRGQKEQGLEFARRATALAAGDAEVYVRASLVFESEGQRGDALETIRMAIDRGYSIDAIKNLDELQKMINDPAFNSIARQAERSGQTVRK